MITRSRTRSRGTAALATVAALSALMLAACTSAAPEPSGSSPAASPTTQEPPADAVSLTWANDAAWHKAGQDAVSELAGEKIGVKVKSEIFPTSEAFQAQVRSSLTTSSAFPVFDWWSGYQMEPVAEAGALMDITDLWQAAVADGRYPASLQELVSWDGVAYGFPKLVNYWVVFYNKHVFEDNGLQPPTTWAELEEISTTLKAKNIYPFGLSMQDSSWQSFIWFEEILIRTDPALYTGVLDGSIAYNDPRIVDALGVWADILKAGWITPTGLLTNENTESKFQSGEYAMFLLGDWWSSSLTNIDMVPGEDFGVFVMPDISAQASSGLIVEVRPTLFSQNAQNAAEARKLAEFLMTTEASTTLAEAMEVNSPNLQVAESTRPVHLRELSKTVADGKYSLLPRYWEGTPTPVVNAVYPLLGKIIENPEDLSSILDETQAAAKAAWPA